MSETAAIVALLDDTVERQMAYISRMRSPSEACGLLVDQPPPGKKSRCIELPNRAIEHHEATQIHGSDIRLALEGWEGQVAAIWHSHPGGNVGPSRGDMESRRDSTPGLGYLVIALTGKHDHIVTWY